MFIAAICHDFKHPGTNNIFQINFKTPLALRYNGTIFIKCIDVSVLENYHVSESFKVLMKDEFNIVEHFSPEEYRIFRKRMINAFLPLIWLNILKTYLL